LLRELPYPEADRLFYLHWKTQSGTLHALSAVKISFWRRYSRTVEAFAACDLATAGVNITAQDGATYAQALHVSSDFFRTLGVHPLRGRGFLAEEERAGSDRVAILTDGLWRRAFHADQNLLGRVIRVDDQDYTVVGVLPRSFVFSPDVDILLPLRMSASSDAQENLYATIARLKPGLKQAQAQADAVAVFSEFRRANPDQVESGALGIQLESYRRWIVGDVRASLLVVFGAVSLVLLIACTDIGVLLLVRIAHRSEEMAVRTALGASKARLARQVMIESLVLAVAGAGLGLLTAAWSLPAIVALIRDDLPRATEISLDLRAAAFSVSAAAASALLFGLLPALRAAGMNVGEWLKQSAQRTTANLRQMRLGYILISGQVALSLLLLIGAALLFESLLRMQSVRLGFNPENQFAFEIALAGRNYESTAQTAAVTERVLDSVRRLPGVVAAAAVSNLPTQAGMNIPLHAEGHGCENESIEYRVVSPEYFLAMGIPLVSGRAFARSDSAGAPAVAIVNETAARLCLAGPTPLGAYVSLGRDLPGSLADRPRQVVAVAGDIRESRPDQEAAPTVYIPVSQTPDGVTSLMNRSFRKGFIFRAEGASANLAQLRRVVPRELSVASARPMPEIVRDTTARLRFQTFLMIAFGGFALLLTGVGIYGVLSFQASQRSHELGIRMSLGARPRQILSLMLRQTVLTTAVGVVAGIAGALGLTRVLAGMLFGLRATDPATFAAASLGITMVALLASYLPVRRITKGHPNAALRIQ
jgi:putative ABC transport system permease protein